MNDHTEFLIRTAAYKEYQKELRASIADLLRLPESDERRFYTNRHGVVIDRAVELSKHLENN